MIDELSELLNADAKISPKNECFLRDAIASIFTLLLPIIEVTSANNEEGAITSDLSDQILSIMMATPKTEVNISGHIGQPAASIISNIKNSYKLIL